MAGVLAGEAPLLVTVARAGGSPELLLGDLVQVLTPALRNRGRQSDNVARRLLLACDVQVRPLWERPRPMNPQTAAPGSRA